MRSNTTKSKEKDLFIYSDPMPCFTSHVYNKTLDYEFSSEALLETRVFICSMDKDFVMKHSL